MIYFDNSAGTYPKPQNVIRRAGSVLESCSFNVGRGGYKASVKTAEKIFEVRELIARMFGFKSENVAFTKNCTEALNFAIKGLAEKGDHFIISPFEHNSVTRVLYKMQKDGKIDFDIARYSKNSDEFINNFRTLVNERTKAVICTHSSNVFGLKMPVREIGAMCRKSGIKFIVDAAQGAGICDIDAKRDNIDILCAPGHKSLFGPSGTGFIAVKDETELHTVIEGGTGSQSLALEQPSSLPDRLESGTLNTAGIILLGYGIKFINKTGIDSILSHETELVRAVYEMLFYNENVKLYTPYPNKNDFVPILSFNFKDYSSEKTAALLAKNDICARGGYHCSPLAHKTFNTLDTGTLRISPGYFNTKKECYKFFNVLKNL